MSTIISRRCTSPVRISILWIAVFLFVSKLAAEPPPDDSETPYNQITAPDIEDRQATPDDEPIETTESGPQSPGVPILQVHSEEIDRSLEDSRLDLILALEGQWIGISADVWGRSQRIHVVDPKRGRLEVTYESGPSDPTAGQSRAHVTVLGTSHMQLQVEIETSWTAPTDTFIFELIPPDELVILRDGTAIARYQRVVDSPSNP